MSDTSSKGNVVLVIDDEAQMRRLLRVCLERHDYRVVEASTGDQGIGEAVRCQPDAVLLDLGLPDMDGLVVLQRLREWSQVPVLVVSVRSHEDDKITALDSGANDYITKPFSTGELLARLRVIQRSGRLQSKVEKFRSGRLSVDLVNRAVTVGGRNVHLTATEYSLLVFLVQHAGKALTHGQILKAIWGTDDLEKTGHLRVYVTRLRDRIEHDPAQPELIITEPGVGYRLVVSE